MQHTPILDNSQTIISHHAITHKLRDIFYKYISNVKRILRNGTMGVYGRSTVFIEYQKINFHIDVIAAGFYGAIILMLHVLTQTVIYSDTTHE